MTEFLDQKQSKNVSNANYRRIMNPLLQMPVGTVQNPNSRSPVSKAPVVYLIGSLRNPEIPKIGQTLRKYGLEVFDDWFAAGPIADDSWQEYEKFKGVPYRDALKSYAARHVFSFDKTHLNRADIGVLVLPAGKSGHLGHIWPWVGQQSSR